MEITKLMNIISETAKSQKLADANDDIMIYDVGYRKNNKIFFDKNRKFKSVQIDFILNTVHYWGEIADIGVKTPINLDDIYSPTNLIEFINYLISLDFDYILHSTQKFEDHNICIESRIENNSDYGEDEPIMMERTIIIGNTKLQYKKPFNQCCDSFFTPWTEWQALNLNTHIQDATAIF